MYSLEHLIVAFHIYDVIEDVIRFRPRVHLHISVVLYSAHGEYYISESTRRFNLRDLYAVITTITPCIRQSAYDIRYIKKWLCIYPTRAIACVLWYANYAHWRAIYTFYLVADIKNIILRTLIW